MSKEDNEIKSAKLSRMIIRLAKEEKATCVELIHACKIVASVCGASLSKIAPSDEVRESNK